MGLAWDQKIERLCECLPPEWTPDPTPLPKTILLLKLYDIRILERTHPECDPTYTPAPTFWV